MNRRLNSILFILAATIVNIIAMVLIFGVFMILFARFIAPHLAPSVNQIVLLVIFVGSVAITYVLYHRLMKWLSRRYPLEKYFGPVFGKDRHPPQ